MHISFSEPVDILKWAYRLLYLQLFISLLVIMGYWHLPFTIPFLGSVLALLLPVLFSKKELLQKQEDATNTPE